MTAQRKQTDSRPIADLSIQSIQPACSSSDLVGENEASSKATGETRMTRKESIAQHVAWSKALEEGRIVRFEDGKFVSFPTVERARQTVVTAREQGINASIAMAISARVVSIAD